MRRHIQKTKPSSWGRRGFLPVEQFYLSEISRAGAQAPYIQAMLRRRISLNANRVKYGWGLVEYRQRIVAEYQRLGIRGKSRWETYAHYFDKTFYDYLGYFKDITPLPKGKAEWETPRVKKRTKVSGETKAQTTRRSMLRQKIINLNDKISKASLHGDQQERARLERGRNAYQNQLDSLR